MNLYGGRLYQVSVIIANVFLLNLIWIFCSFPLVTLFPATAAMYSVVREWILHKNTSVFGLFFKYFKVNFKQSFLFSLVWYPVCIFLVIDFNLYLTTHSLQLLIVTVFLGFLFLLITTFLFPIMVHFKGTYKTQLHSIILMPLYFLPTSFILLVTQILIGLIFYLAPITGFIIFSCYAYVNYFLCHRAFNKLMEKQKYLIV